VKALLDVYAQQFRITLASFVQYRASIFIYTLWHVLEPVIYLVVWSTVSRARQGSVGGFSAGDFVAYFVAVMLVNHFTYTWIFYEFDYRIRHGALSMALLRPLHPIHSDVVDNLSSKLITLPVMLGAAGLLALVFGATVRVQPWALAAFVPALALAVALRFAVEWTLALAAFWTTRMSAVIQGYYMVLLFLSGQMAPLGLLPEPVQRVAAALPFRWMVSFPVELALGRLSPAQALAGLGMQALWLAVAALVLRTVWRAGLRAYSAVGA
jgi:viologen exporter family transport system permease protein